MRRVSDTPPPSHPGDLPAPWFLADVARPIAHPVFVKDRASRMVWVNDAMCALVGRPREEMLGTRDDELYPKEQAAFFLAKDGEVFEHGRQILIEEEAFTDASGVGHVLSTTKVPLRSPGGEITHLLGIVHDITRLKSAEEALRLANEELERRVEARTRDLRDAQHALLRKERLAVLGQLSGGLAHQIRTPLSTITNAAAVLRRRLESSDDALVQQAMSIITEEVWEANRIITDLLDFVRVRPPSSVPVPVSALVDGALGTARPPAGITVIRDLPDDLIALVDERQTRDALGNVIRNAIEAMGEEGRLTFRASADPAYAHIRVEDTGPGIADDALVHLFEPLVTTKALGLGLGLTTARALIENQKGDIRYVKPEPGALTAGACFEIRVPLATPDGLEGVIS